jgi:hypothetical protein
MGALALADIVDIVIAVTLVEALVLVLCHRVFGTGVAPRDWVLNLSSGLCLMLALRCGVRDAPLPWTLLFLAAAGLAHGSDLWRRWRRRPVAGAATPRVLQ